MLVFVRVVVWTLGIVLASLILIFGCLVGSAKWLEWSTLRAVPDARDSRLVGEWIATPPNDVRTRRYRFQADGSGTLTYSNGNRVPFLWGTRDESLTIRHFSGDGYMVPTYPYRLDNRTKSMKLLGAPTAYSFVIRDYSRPASTP